MITLYRSDDAGAPVLSGTAGALITVLNACLVTGYGDQPAAGWTRPYTGTQLAVYRPAAGTQFHLRVDDTQAQYPVLRGYRGMTGVNAGTGPFPTLVQLSGGIRTVKSATASGTARPWLLLASPRAWYLWISFNATDMGAVNPSVDLCFFGDVHSYLPGDAYAAAIIGRINADTAASSTLFANALTTGAPAAGHYLASDFAQSGNAAQCACLQSVIVASTAAGAAGSFYPDPITGGMLLERLRLVEGGTPQKLVRGHLPGCYNPIHPVPATHLDVLQGRGAMLGTDMLVLYKGGTEGRVVLSLNEADWYPEA